MRTVALAAVLVLLLGACASAQQLAGSPSAEPSSASDSTAPPAPAKHPSVAPSPSENPPGQGLPKIIGEVGAFSSPSGNIGCVVTSSAARCDIGDHSYQPPAQPDGCVGSWGRSLRIGSGAAAYICATDSTIGAGKVLEYGTSTVIGNYGCASRRTGVTCLNLQTDHGFKVSRAKVKVF